MAAKVAIVTGASQGIGLGITSALLERGYSVVAMSRRASQSKDLDLLVRGFAPHPNPSGLSHFAQNSPPAFAGAPPNKLVTIDGDVGEPAAAQQAVDLAMSRFDGLDLLVNNAGVFIPKPFTDYTKEDYDVLLSTNFAGFFHMTQAALRRMVHRKSGHIVNIGASLAAQPIAGVPSALPMLIKGGIEAATRSLAIEYAPHGVRVNTIAAGVIDTPMHREEHHGFLRSTNPAGRLGRVEEIADAVLYLDDAGFVSGEILHVDGGAHAGKWS